MRVYALVPVQEALHVDDVSHLQLLHCLVNVGSVITQIRFHNKAVGLTIQGNVEVQIVAVLSGAIPVIKESHLVSVCICGRLHGHALEGNVLVLMVDQLILAKQICHIRHRSNILALKDFEGRVDDLHLAGPLSFIAGNPDLCADIQLLIIFLRACHVVQEVCAVLVLCVNGRLVLPPGLLRLHVGLDSNLGIKLCRHIFLVCHNALGLYVCFCFLRHNAGCGNGCKRKS